MIVFHEGLPGSGKSYEACVMHILPALKAGRDVLTNINGINHKKFSDLTGIPLPIIEQKLVCISHSDCGDEEQRLELVKADILAKTKKDSLIVIDEVQDIHPTKRQPLSAEWSKYIASHRHEGLDIVLMGQDRRDVHPIWRRRIQRLLTFNKLQAVGASGSYHWVCYEATAPEKFKQVSSGNRSYDKQYFGCYLSHTQGTNNKSVYRDDRANILKNKNLQLAVVVFFALAFWGINKLMAFFDTDKPVHIAKASSSSAFSSGASSSVHNQKTAVAATVSPKPAVKPDDVPPVDIFDQEAKKGRLRLAAVLYTDDKLFFRIEIIDNFGRLYASYDRRSLEDLGWDVQHESYGITLSKQTVSYVARQWALESSYTQVNRRTIESLAH